MQFRPGETPFYGPKTARKATQDGSKIAPRRPSRVSCFIFVFVFDFGPFWVPFWVPSWVLFWLNMLPARRGLLGSRHLKQPQATHDAPKAAQHRQRPLQDAPRGAQECQRPSPGPPKTIQIRPKTARRWSQRACSCVIIIFFFCLFFSFSSLWSLLPSLFFLPSFLFVLLSSVFVCFFLSSFFPSLPLSLSLSCLSFVVPLSLSLSLLPSLLSLFSLLSFSLLFSSLRSLFYLTAGGSLPTGGILSRSSDRLGLPCLPAPGLGHFTPVLAYSLNK